MGKASHTDYNQIHNFDLDVENRIIYINDENENGIDINLINKFTKNFNLLSKKPRKNRYLSK